MDQTTEVFRPLQADDPVAVAGYRLAARLGAGGMGRVYLSHTQGGRPVALKVVRPELADDPDFRRRFRREVTAARRVRGAYTAELIDADPDATPPWLATLYVPGPSLADAVARRGPLPVAAVLWLMAGVAEALQAIHAEGVVHRDLKPSNVLLAADGPRVIDFGIALAADGTSYTATGSTIGTPAFMAPEQATGGEVTAATDVFALGQTAAFAALGRPLYGEGPGVNVLYRIVHSEPDLSLLPEPLRPLFARCLAADPAERVTPAEIVEWCRRRLGAEDGAGGGPAVWREITGPEAAVPAPVPEPTAVAPRPLVGYPPPGWLRPTAQERRTRRRRAALMSVAVAVGAVLAVILASSVMDAKGRSGARHTAGGVTTSGSPGSGGPRSSASASGSGSAGSSDTGGVPGAARTPSASPAQPRAEDYGGSYLDASTPLSIEHPYGKGKDDKGALRLGCRTIGCELDAGDSTIVQMYGAHGTTLDECRLILKDATRHRWTLTGAAAGSEFCVRHPSGDVALFVLRIKSTAMPEAAFLEGDLTVWRDASRDAS
ncbi:serine/threonine-protein kinase [Streptomyces lavenduligriseus]|uniref:Serine/threonine protein kinase n=1 Tax=Streptomyces lavenduligriseus TaxID=67315 RepID=A0ABT0NX87_9ACTN|nr:serine/threonine-protein kinase [Streptomyces lavenduligriseus]MCL3995422.1 serine/threonine protein kinase [Streptomyces lavenduligriseus]